MFDLPSDSRFRNSIGLVRMKIYSQIIGNIADEVWHDVQPQPQVEYVVLDQWTAQKSRFVAHLADGRECAIALGRNTRLRDGDILAYDADEHRMLVVRLCLSEVMIVDCRALRDESPDEIVQTAVELGHALGNQHWPAVVKGLRVYVPLTVDKKVMRSVMHTHNLPHLAVSFLSADDVVPYLAPHEVRRLFGGAAHSEHHHTPHNTAHYEHR